VKLVAEKAEDLDLMDDPRPKDRVMWNRLRLVLEAELCNEAWGCKLYQMHREGFIDLEARKAGDKYQVIHSDWVKWNLTDPDVVRPEAKQFVEGKIARAKRKYQDCRIIMGLRQKVVDMVVLRDEWPVYETQKREVRLALDDLATFFAKGTKRKQKIAL
jgi:hypothetical protein